MSETATTSATTAVEHFVSFQKLPSTKHSNQWLDLTADVKHNFTQTRTTLRDDYSNLPTFSTHWWANGEKSLPDNYSLYYNTYNHVILYCMLV